MNEHQDTHKSNQREVLEDSKPAGDEQIMTNLLNPTVHDGSVTMDHIKIGTHEQKLHVANTIHVYPTTSNNTTSTREVGASKNFDYKFKLLLVGNPCVGKTSLLLRYSENDFQSNYISTIGIDFKVKTIMWQNKIVKLQIWDTAGQERFKTITTAYYRGASGVILMYDVTNEESFNSIPAWHRNIISYAPQDIQVILVGNKIDMDDKRVISTDVGKNLAEKMNTEFGETSARENINVKVVFEHLVDILCDKTPETGGHLTPGNKPLRLTEVPVTRNQGCVVNC